MDFEHAPQSEQKLVNSLEEIQDTLSGLSVEQLARRSVDTWKIVDDTKTKEDWKLAARTELAISLEKAKRMAGDSWDENTYSATVRAYSADNRGLVLMAKTLEDPSFQSTELSEDVEGLSQAMIRAHESEIAARLEDGRMTQEDYDKLMAELAVLDEK